MKQRNATILAVCLIFGTATFAASQSATGVEHWVNNGPIRLYVWEKYVGSAKDKPVIVLCHGSATAGKESFDAARGHRAHDGHLRADRTRIAKAGGGEDDGHGEPADGLAARKLTLNRKQMGAEAGESKC